MGRGKEGLSSISCFPYPFVMPPVHGLFKFPQNGNSLHGIVDILALNFLNSCTVVWKTEKIVVCMSRFVPCTQNVWVGKQEEMLNQCAGCGV